MKGKKCFGLLFLLAIMLGLSLSVCSDVNALKHNITSIPFYTMNYILPGNIGFSSSGYFSISQSGLEFDSSKTSAPLAFKPVPSPSSSPTKCVFSSSGSDFTSEPARWTYFNSSISLGSAPYFNFYDQAFSSIPDSYCLQHIPFGVDSHLSMDWSGLSNIFTRFNDLKPYSYEYNGFYLSDDYITDTGFVYSNNSLSLSQFLGFDNVSQLSSPSSMTIPFGVLKDFKSSDYTTVSSGTPIDLHFEFLLRGVYGYNLSDLSSQLSPVLHWSLLDSNYDEYSGTTFCSYTIDDIIHDESYHYGLYYDLTCPFVSSYDVYDDMLSFYLDLSPSSGSSSIWSVNFQTPSSDQSDVDGSDSDIVFIASGIDFVTNYDDTPGLPCGVEINGSDPDKAPGSAYWVSNPDDGDVNWLSSLTNLFHFSFLNPFAPMFALFTDSSSCASIPIIAGMLHSSETSYCPWFSSNTRSILTPVLGLASAMLIFGFAVRWLGSSSGNLFEDAGHIEPPGGFTADVRGRNVQRRGWRRSK